MDEFHRYSGGTKQVTKGMLSNESGVLEFARSYCIIRPVGGRFRRRLSGPGALKALGALN
jgi:hypothetical protein